MKKAFMVSAPMAVAIALIARYRHVAEREATERKKKEEDRKWDEFREDFDRKYAFGLDLHDFLVDKVSRREIYDIWHLCIASDRAIGDGFHGGIIRGL